MLECGQGEDKSGTMKDASGDMSIASSEKANRLTYKLVRVERDGSFVPASEDEVTEVEHLLAEPKNEEGLVDGVLCFDTQNAERCLAVECFPFPVDYHQIKTDSGVLDSHNNLKGREESKFEYLDGMLQGVDEVGLHVTNGLSSVGDDYLLDTEFSEKAPDLDFGQCEGSHLGNLGLDGHSSRLSGSDRGVVEMSKLSTTVISVPESAYDQNSFLLDKMTIRELQEAFRSTFGRETSVKDKQWLKRRISFGLQNFVELDNVSCLMESKISSNESGSNMILTSNYDSSRSTSCTFANVLDNKTKPVDKGVERDRLGSTDVSTRSFLEAGNVGGGPLNLGDRESVLLTQKRLRKPTRRYIEESSDLKSRSCRGRLETPGKSSRDKLMRIRSHNQHPRKGFGAMPLVCRQDSLWESGIQVPFGLRVRKGRPKKQSSMLMHDYEDNMDELGPSPAESQDEMSDDSVTRTRTEKGGTRRKHHRLWSLSEVMKLIDGVSRYGVGRWTEIKRLLFSSSAYRTSVDLKDKWRNLLRASGAQLQSKREVEQGRKHATRPIPPSVLRRVNELAIIYPYPRERKSKLTRGTPAAAIPVALNSSSSDASVSRSGRVIHRKNLI